MKILIDRDGTFMGPAKTKSRAINTDGDIVTVTEGLRPGRQVIEAELPPRDRMWWRGGQWEDKPPMSPISPEDAAAAEEENRLRDLIASMLPKFPPPQQAAVSEPEPPEPEHHFADLMLADETMDDARARLSQRLRELRHYLIAPEIKVNEDGSVGLTAGEQAELQDLERRQTLGRWLEA
jgi:hypothetical protein